MRLHKWLANQGVASRRTIETWIKEGKIQVNGQVAQIGQLISMRDKIALNGKMLRFENPAEFETQVVLYHKPEGEICSQGPQEKRTVFASLPSIREGKWVMVGRLDVNTSGLLLFTNNGELAHRLMHPRYEIQRHYAVRVLGTVTEKILMRLQEGVMLVDGKVGFKQITPLGGRGANQWFHVILGEGKYREVRRLWESQGCTVSRLIRIQYGQVNLPRDLRRGKWVTLSPQKIQSLLMSVDLDTQTTC